MQQYRLTDKYLIETDAYLMQDETDVALRSLERGEPIDRVLAVLGHGAILVAGPAGGEGSAAIQLVTVPVTEYEDLKVKAAELVVLQQQITDGVLIVAPAHVLPPPIVG